MTNRALITTSTLGLMVIQLNTSADAVLKHRYNFSETNATVVADSVTGGGNGNVIGSGVKREKGQIILPGGASDSGAAYVELPANIISSLSNVTIEAWATWADTSEEPWQRIFDFGSSEEGKGKSGKGFSYLMLTTKRFGDDTISFEATRSPDDDPDKTVLLANSSPAVDREYYYAVVYDPGANVSKLYVNGKQAAADKAPRPLSKINDANNLLGRSQWGDNSLFKGSFNEVRIWEGALTADQIADHQKGGPDQKLQPKLPGKESTPARPDDARKKEADKKDKPAK